MIMRTWGVFITGLCALCSISTAARAELVLVDEGVSPAPIVVYENAPPRTRDAAEELAVYIQKISGVKPQVIHGAPQPPPDRAIWVGDQPLLRTLMPGVNFEFKHPEETLIVANDHHLVIAGRDRWDPQHMTGKGRLAEITGRQQEYGTVNAVYTFLQDHLHVRWLWPGDDGEDILPRKRIALTPMQKRYHPQIRARAGMFIRLSLGDSKEGPPQIWWRRQRGQLDSLELGGGHGFGAWWEKYSKSNPEFFALQPDGTRTPHGDPHRVKLCDSNPAVWQQWLKEVEEQLQRNPNQRVFNASPNDGYTSGYCVCANCRAWDHPAAEKMTYTWKGHKEELPMMTERQVIFANHLARLLKQRYPDKDLFVQLHAYGSSRPAPIEARPADNVIISSVANFHLRGNGVRDDRDQHMKQFDDWSKRASHLAWRPNLGSPAGLSWGMPDVAMNWAAEDFRFVAERGCVGLFFDMFWNHWATQGPHYYMLAQLAWNPFADSEAVMDDYYRRGFGPAADEIKAYWTLMQDTRNAFVNEVPNRLRAFGVHQRYTPQFFARAKSLLDAAEKKLAGAPEIYRRRVAFVRSGLEHAQLVVETRELMAAYEASGGKDAALAEKVKANWKRAEEMNRQRPPYAVNFQATFAQTTGKRMVGLHPDQPLAGRTLKEFNQAGLE